MMMHQTWHVDWRWWGERVAYVLSAIPIAAILWFVLASTP